MGEGIVGCGSGGEWFWWGQGELIKDICGVGWLAAGWS